MYIFYIFFIFCAIMCLYKILGVIQNMKINKLHSKHILKKSLGYTFIMYYHTDINNNTCFTLTVKNRTLKIKEHIILTYPTYISGMFYGKIKEYIFDVIECSINLKIDNLGLSNVLHIEKNTDNFIIHKSNSVLYEQLFIPGCENYDKLYIDLEHVITNYKNYF